MQKMYHEFAQWWPLLSPVAEYEEEAAFVALLLKEIGLPADASLLELGAGGGNNAFFLKTLFADVVLSDLSKDMLAVSEEINPDCIHIQGDMCTLRLDQQFDVVFVHDAIDYMTTPIMLRQAMETTFVHCKPGGTAVLIPDFVRETFTPTTEHGGSNSSDRAMRYLEWCYDPDENDTCYTTEYVYLLREGADTVHQAHERHICGLFARADWLNWLESVGFQSSTVLDSYNRDHFIGRKSHTGAIT